MDCFRYVISEEDIDGVIDGVSVGNFVGVSNDDGVNGIKDGSLFGDGVFIYRDDVKEVDVVVMNETSGG